MVVEYAITSGQGRPSLKANVINSSRLDNTSPNLLATIVLVNNKWVTTLNLKILQYRIFHLKWVKTLNWMMENNLLVHFVVYNKKNKYA